MTTSPQEPLYCSGVLCNPTLQADGNGFCFSSPAECVRSSGYELPEKYCASTCCSAVPADFPKVGPTDICTASRHTCLYASKHKHAFRFHPNLN